MKALRRTVREEIDSLLSSHRLVPGELIVVPGQPRRPGVGLLVGARVAIQFLPWQKGTSRICDLDVRAHFLAPRKEWSNDVVQTARGLFEEAASHTEMAEAARASLAQLDAETISAHELEGIEIELVQSTPSGDKARRLREAACPDGVWRFSLIHLDTACTVRVFGASEPRPVIHQKLLPELRKLLKTWSSSLATNRSREISGHYWKLVGEKHPEGWFTLDVEPLVAETQAIPVEVRHRHCRFQPTLAYRGTAKLLRFSRLHGGTVEPLFPEEISKKKITDDLREDAFSASMLAQAESDDWGSPDFFEIVASDQRLQRTKISRHVNGIQIRFKAVFPEGQVVVSPNVAVKCCEREQVALLEFDPSLKAWTGELVMQVPLRVARLAQITLHLSPGVHQ